MLSHHSLGLIPVHGQYKLHVHCLPGNPVNPTLPYTYVPSRHYVEEDTRSVGAQYCKHMYTGFHIYYVLFKELIDHVPVHGRC